MLGEQLGFFFQVWGPETFTGRSPLSVVQCQSQQAELSQDSNHRASNCSQCAPTVCKLLRESRVERQRVPVLKKCVGTIQSLWNRQRRHYRTSHQPNGRIKKSKWNNISQVHRADRSGHVGWLRRTGWILSHICGGNIQPGSLENILEGNQSMSSNVLRNVGLQVLWGCFIADGIKTIM